MQNPWDMDWSAQQSEATGTDAAPWKQNWAKPAAEKPVRKDGDTMTGFKRAFAQVPELAYGAGALTAMSAEHLFGGGGLSTAAKDYFIDKYSAKKAENEKYAPTVDFTDAWDNLKKGNVGSMVDWLQDSAGYVAGQAAQTLVTAGVGAIAGKAAVTTAAEKMLSGVVAKQAAKIAEEQAAKQGLGEAAIAGLMPAATKLAATRIAEAVGAGVALSGQNLGMEAGDIFGGLSAEAEKSGKEISGDDLLRAWGSAAAAAGTEVATDLLGIGAMTGRIKIGGKAMQSMTGAGGRVARGATAAAVGMPLEAGQEYVQTWLEQYGAGTPTDTPEAQRERVNAAAVGGLGGGMVGGGAGLLQSAQPETPAPAPSEPAKALTYQGSDAMVVFPDGTTMTAAEAKDRGLNKQVVPKTETAPLEVAYTVMSAKSVDEAIQAASGVVTGIPAIPYDEGAAQAGLINADYEGKRQAELRQQGIEPAPGAGIPAFEEPAPVEPPKALTDQGDPAMVNFPDGTTMTAAEFKQRGFNKQVVPQTPTEPTAMELALRAAQEKKGLLNSAPDTTGIEKPVKNQVEEPVSTKPDVTPTPVEAAKPVTENGWAAFDAKSGTLGIPRAEMPQVKAEHRGALVNFLKARDVTSQHEEVPANTIKATQAEFSPAKVKQAQDFQGGDRSILISSDNHIVDGHHQWLAKAATGEPIQVIRLDAPIKELLPLVSEFPSSESAAGISQKQMDESDQERSYRLWGENYSNVAGLADLSVASTVDLERAYSFGSSITAKEKRKGWDGGAVNDDLVRSMQVDLDAINNELKKRRQQAEAAPAPTQATEQPATQPAADNPLRPMIESLIKRRAASRQSGIERSVNTAIERAKAALAGGDAKPGYFSTLAKTIKGKDATTAGILDQIAAHLKNPKPAETPATTPTAKPAGFSAAEIGRREKLKQKARARKQIDMANDSIIKAIAKLGGLSMDHRLDITGDNKGNRQVPFVGHLFSQNGRGLDDMATSLAQYGYLTDEEMDTVDGGVQALRDKIREEYDGSKSHYSNVGEEDRLANERDMQGLASEQQEEVIDLKDEYADLNEGVVADSNWLTMSEDEQNAEIDSLFGGTNQEADAASASGAAQSPAPQTDPDRQAEVTQSGRQSSPDQSVSDGVSTETEGSGDPGKRKPASPKSIGRINVDSASGGGLVSADLLKLVGDGAGADAQTLSNLSESEPFKSQGFRALNIPQRMKVLNGVIALGKNLKIRRAIIETIPVDMMNMLVGEQFSADALFSDITVLKNVFSADAESPVAIGGDPTFAGRFVGVAAKTAAEARVSAEDGVAAGGTLDVRHDVTPNSDVGLGAADAETSAAPSSIPKESLELTGETPADLLAKTQQATAQAQLEAAQALKGAADAMRDSFTLTGSARPADEAAARGQSGLFENSAPTPTGETVPAGDERKAINEAIQTLVDTVDTKKTDRGTAMFSRAGRDFAADFVTELSANDELFRHRVSASADLGTVFREVAPTYRFMGDDSRADERSESNADRRFAVVTPKRKVFHVYERGNEVWIDVSRLDPGEGGNYVYAAVLNYAHNAKKVLIGDPAAVSADAVIRRTVAMLSSALRFGTTRHMKPALEQSEGNPEAGIAPLEWGSDNTENVRNLIDTFLQTTYNQNPEIEDIRYDFASRQFVENGEPVTQKRFDELAETFRDRTGRTGEASIRRAGLLQSLVRSESSERPGLLEDVFRRSAEYVSGGMAASGAEGSGQELAGLRGVFARNQSPENGVSGLTMRDAQSVFDRIAPTFTNLPPVNLLNRPGELPDRVKELRNQIRAAGAWGDVEGAYHDGEIFIFTDNIADEARFEHVLFEHEIRHYGLRGAFGKELDGILNGLLTRNPELRKKAAELRTRLGLDSNVTAVEEVLADLPMNELVTLKGFDRFIAFVRDWLAKHKFTKLAARMDALLVDRVGEQVAADALVTDVIMAARDFARNGKPDKADLYMRGTRFMDTEGDGNPSKLRALWNQYDDTGELTFSDLVDEVEALILADETPSGDMLQDAVDRWREEKEFDRDLAGRGDMEAADAAFEGALKAAMNSRSDQIQAPKFRVALRLQNGQVVTANSDEYIHSQIFNRLTEEMPEMLDDSFAENADFGFVDSSGKYFTRDEATALLGREAQGETLGDNALMFSRADQTNTPAFKAWFKDSKVVDADGKPLVVYHGTEQNFDEFDRRASGLNTSHPTAHLGIFTSTSPTVSGLFIKAKSGTVEEDAAIRAASNLSYKMAREAGFNSVFDMEPGSPERNAIHDAVSKVSGSGVRSGGSIMPLYLSIKNPLTLSWDQWYKAANWIAGTNQEGMLDIEKIIKSGGHDGIFLPRQEKASAEYAGDTWIAFKPEQIKSAVGNRGTFDPNNGDIRFSRSGNPDWVLKGPAALKSAAGKIDTFAPEQTIGDKVKALTSNWQKRLVQGIFDAYAPLKDLSHKAYVLARMTKSADGVLEGMLLYGKPVMDADGAIVGDVDGKGFLGAMKELKGEHDRFFMWVAGNRAERLLNEGREHLFSADEVKAMKELNRGKMADGSSREAAFVKALTSLRDYNKSVMDIAEKTGLIDGAARHLWEHDFYIPFYRVMEDDKISGPGKIKGLVRQQAFKKLKGGQENLGDLMANTLRNWSHLLSASLANQAAVKSLDAAVKVGAAEEVPAGTKGATFAMIDGKQTHFEINDPFLLDAISAIESASFKGLPMKLMSKFKHYLTLGVTVSPTFRIRNLMRDTISAMGQNDMSFNAMTNLVEGFKGTDKKSANYASMLFGGGMMRFGTYLEGDRAEHVRRLIDDGVDPETILTNPRKVKAALGKLWDSWQDFGDRMENVNRAALYQQYIAQGKSHLEASYAARDMMDFSMQGSWVAMRILSQVVPFLNARAQGLYKLGRAAKQDPKRMGYVTGAVALASIALLLAYDDDEDWKAREDWDRDAFWWFKIGDTSFRIPKPFEIGAMGTLAERGVELMINDEMTGARFGERMKQMLLGTFALNPTPQMVKPMLDIYANTDSFTGRQIETMGMDKLSKSERTTANSTLVAKALGAAGDYTNLSPVQVDHLIRAYFGWLGTHAALTVDLMATPFKDGERPTPRVGDLFVIGDFIKDLPQAQSRYVEQFYKQAKAVSEVMADIKHAREVGDMERAQEILDENRDKVALSKLYENSQRSLSKINKQIRLVQSKDSLSGDEKRVRLDYLMAARNRLAEAVNDRATAARQ